MADVTYAGQIVREAPEIEAYKLGLLQSAKRQIEQPISMPAYQAAGLSDLQQAATGAGAAYQQAGQGIGGYAPFLTGAAQQLGAGVQSLTAAGEGISGINVQPYFDTAGLGMTAAAQTSGSISPYITGMGAGLANIGQGTQTLGAAQQAAGLGTGMFDPTMAQQYMNPYQQQVIDEAIKQINRQGDIQQQNLAAQAVRSGAFGGTREGVQRAELGRNLAEAQNQAIIGGLQQGYGQAMNTAQQSYEAARQRQLATGQALAGIGQAQSQQGMMGANILGQQAGLLGQQAQLQSGIAQGIGSLGAQQAQTGLGLASGLAQIGQGLGGLGIQQAQLGTTAQQLAQGDINTYLGLGGLQQQTAQNQLDAARATELQRTMMPYQQLGFLSDIYKGAPTSSSTLTAMSAPSTSPLLQAAGLGMAAIGTAAGAKSAGLF
jgi:hypothetical protein